MPYRRDLERRRNGTRVRLYPQSPVLAAVAEPETVWLSAPAGSVGAGPADARMYVVDPLHPKAPYEFPELPPFRGAAHPPVTPGPDGHFDHLLPGTREFNAVHMFGTVRRVLDVWEDYLGHPVRWHFEPGQPRLELVPWLRWDNAHSGFGFIEAGAGESDDGLRHAYALNFDVLAHELGHSILFSQVGIPPPGGITAEYLALHESFADLIAMLAALHFESVAERLLAQCHGNLYTQNELNRIAEIADDEQIRIAGNALSMRDVAEAYGEDSEACDEHRFGQPLTGALFDILVDVFLVELVAGGAIARPLAERARAAPDPGVDYRALDRAFAGAHARAPDAFTRALAGARDYLGALLADLWVNLDPSVRSFSVLHRGLLDADRRVSAGVHAGIVSDCLLWRGIGVHQTWPSTEMVQALERQAGPDAGRGRVAVRLAPREPFLARALRASGP